NDPSENLLLRWNDKFHTRYIAARDVHFERPRAGNYDADQPRLIRARVDLWKFKRTIRPDLRGELNGESGTEQGDRRGAGWSERGVEADNTPADPGPGTLGYRR